MKLRELFGGLTAKDGTEDQARIRIALAEVQEQQSAAKQQLAGIAERRTSALLNDDDAALDKLDREAEKLHRLIERAEFAAPELEKRLAAAMDRHAEARRADAYAAASAAAAEADRRLRRDYGKHAQAILELISAAASAVADVESANRNLPGGKEPIALPEILRRTTPSLPEEVLQTDLVQRWAFENGKLVGDQSAVRDLGHGAGTLESNVSNIPCIRVTCNEVRYLPAIERQWRVLIWECLRLPALLPDEQPDFWRPGACEASEVAQLVEESMAVDRMIGRRPQRTPQVRLEPL
ncbi:MAG TPA: hypothetical protein VIL72_02070 [Beijerinckiaceae bacterium]|jgi:hypothetical protein